MLPATHHAVATENTGAKEPAIGLHGQSSISRHGVVLFGATLAGKLGGRCVHRVLRGDADDFPARQYLGVTTGGDLMQGENIEHLTNVFHPWWLIGLLIVAVVLYVASFVGLWFAKPPLQRDGFDA
jgi:hypothetical protein